MFLFWVFFSWIRTACVQDFTSFCSWKNTDMHNWMSLIQNTLSFFSRSKWLFIFHFQLFFFFWRASYINHKYKKMIAFKSLVSQFSCSVVSDSLQPHESQHTRPPCPSPTPEFTQIHVHQVGDAIQPSHSLSSTSPPAPNPSQHQSLFQWVNSSHEVPKVLEFQL